jgi:hypothetical protein
MVQRGRERLARRNTPGYTRISVYEYHRRWEEGTLDQNANYHVVDPYAGTAASMTAEAHAQRRQP